MVTRNWRTCVFYTNSRTRWHEGVLYIMQRPPFKCICTHTHTHRRSCKRKFKLHRAILYSIPFLFFSPCFSSSLLRFEHFSYYLFYYLFFCFLLLDFFILLLFVVLFFFLFPEFFAIIPWTRSKFASRLSLVFLREEQARKAFSCVFNR